MAYTNNRRVNNTSTSNASGRTVSYSSGGLNERFSKIANIQQQQQKKNTTPVRPVGPSNASVFSRLRGAKPVLGRTNKSNIQNRLGRIGGGNIKKKQQQKVVPVRGKRVVAKKVVQKKGGLQKKLDKKPTAEDLDRALDDYMMKDPKAMQARLDDDITSYMREAEDILMDDNL